jgi:hypothetical protein
LEEVAAPKNHHYFAWGLIGICAQILFTAGWVVTETWQGPHYSPIANSISDMQAQTAPHVWFPVASFALAGIGTFAFVVFGLRPALAAAGKTGQAGLWMLAAAGLAIGNSFPLIPCRLSDPGCTAAFQLNSPGGLTDAVVASLAFLVLVLAPFPIGRRLAVLPEWRQLRPVVIAARVLGPGCFLLLAISSSLTSMPALGLIERALSTTCVLWIFALAVTLARQARRIESRPLTRHLAIRG